MMKNSINAKQARSTSESSFSDRILSTIYDRIRSESIRHETCISDPFREFESWNEIVTLDVKKEIFKQLESQGYKITIEYGKVFINW
jgi:hypothetical protein